MERSNNVETGKTSQIATETSRYNLTVLEILETHWTQGGKKAKYGRDAVMLRSRRGKCSTHSGSCSDAAGYEDIIGRHGLDTNKLNEFKIALNNRFQALQDLLKEEESTMEGNWKGIKEAITSTCQEVLGLNKYHHKEWISIETLDRNKERKEEQEDSN
ncbi:unnamed protein product [Schistosoma curassoni]|uniref:Uncharacterized protein n=1 Tax=Schistosoma curassoni TaxID=6186 RepID=A0A183KE92_9TREM|nr:unnamed protein product [Schistosoma curassoni]